MEMDMTRTFLTLGTITLLLAACTAQPLPEKTVGGPPIGSTATSGPYLTPQGAGPQGIDRNYYTGADPNFPEGSTGRR
jgi:hypothetical protein